MNIETKGGEPADERAFQRRSHELKTDPAVFEAAHTGAKTFEIRFNDRGFAVGDTLLLRETQHTGDEMHAGAPLVYTGRELTRTVSHVLTGYGLADGWCCLSYAESKVCASVGVEPDVFFPCVDDKDNKRLNRIEALMNTTFDGKEVPQVWFKRADVLRIVTAALASPAPSVGEPVATVHRGGLGGQWGKATTLVRWEAGAESLPDGEHKVYLATPPAAPAVTEVLVNGKIVRTTQGEPP